MALPPERVPEKMCGKRFPGFRIFTWSVHCPGYFFPRFFACHDMSPAALYPLGDQAMALAARYSMCQRESEFGRTPGVRAGSESIGDNLSLNSFMVWLVAERAII